MLYISLRELRSIWQWQLLLCFPKHFFHLLGGSTANSHTSFLLVRIHPERDSDCHIKTIFLSLSCWLWIIVEVQCYTDIFFSEKWSTSLSCSGILYSVVSDAYSVTPLPKTLQCVLRNFYHSVFFSCYEMRWFLSVSSPKSLPWAVSRSLWTSKIRLLILSLNITESQNHRVTEW